jgi:hypothetical protein
MPAWAKPSSPTPASPDLDRSAGSLVLGTWADEGSRQRAHEQAARDSCSSAARLKRTPLPGRVGGLQPRPDVIFIDLNRKRSLHESCVRTYAAGAPFYDPPASRSEVYRRRAMKGYLRLPRIQGPALVGVLFHGHQRGKSCTGGRTPCWNAASPPRLRRTGIRDFPSCRWSLSAPGGRCDPERDRDAARS